jgi:hypothetical protein
MGGGGGDDADDIRAVLTCAVRLRDSGRAVGLGSEYARIFPSCIPAAARRLPPGMRSLGSRTNQTDHQKRLHLCLTYRRPSLAAGAGPCLKRAAPPFLLIFLLTFFFPGTPCVFFSF